MKVINTKIALFGVLLGTGLFSAGEVGALSYQNNVNVSFTFEPTVTVAIGGGDLIINNLALGSAANSNVITVTAGSNSGAGYYLYATAGSSTSGDTYYDTNELKRSGTSDTFTSLTGNVSDLNNINAGYWGYTYSAHGADTWVSGNAGSTSSGYNGLPKSTSGNGVTLVNTSSTDFTTFDFKIAAKATDNQASGVYSNVVNFAAVAKPITTSYTITYYDGATAMSTPAPVSNTISSGNTVEVVLDATATKSGYTLEGWCYGTVSAGKCNGTLYQPGSTYTVGNIGGTATIPLYAMWKKILYPYMQDQTTSSLAAMMPNVGDAATLTDKRDEHEYSVAKIGSLYWMTRNLDLPGGTTLTPSDSNVTSNYTLPASSTSGFSDNSTAYVYNSDSTNFNDTSCGGNDPCYSYYSYAAATAGTNPSSGEASSDICPKGWRLPTKAEFTSLGETYSSGPALTASPWLGVYAGVYSNSILAGIGNSGRYWASTGKDSTYAYVISYYNSSDALVGLYERHNGLPIRCVAKS